MTTYKVKYKRYIADFYVPKNPKGKMVVLVPGLPKSRNIEPLIEPLVEEGCYVLYPSFSGSFDSAGNFSGMQAIADIKSFIEFAQKRSFKELYFGKTLSIKGKQEITVVGISFGALPALLGNTQKADKVVLLSPALLMDNRDINKIIPFDFLSQMKSLGSLLRNALPFSYRISSYKDMDQFLQGKQEVLSQVSVIKKLTQLSVPVLVIHGKRDTSIPWRVSEFLKNESQNKHIKWYFPTNTAHSISSYTKASIRKVVNFIKSTSPQN